jgi:trimeric autotransporter adhesin
MFFISLCVLKKSHSTPNPFAESTSITYTIPTNFKSAQLIFTSTSGEIVKVIEIKTAGKGLINVYAQGIASGLYTYSLKINGVIVESKKMLKM